MGRRMPHFRGVKGHALKNVRDFVHETRPRVKGGFRCGLVALPLPLPMMSRPAQTIEICPKVLLQ